MPQAPGNERRRVVSRYEVILVDDSSLEEFQGELRALADVGMNGVARGDSGQSGQAQSSSSRQDEGRNSGDLFKV